MSTTPSCPSLLDWHSRGMGYGLALAVAICVHAGLFSPNAAAAEPVATVLARFDAPLTHHNGLMLADDGYLYGTTSEGGISNGGTIFRLSRDGELTMLHAFRTDDSSPQLPLAPLIQASDAQLYGTSERGGALGRGAIYRLTASGHVETVYSLTTADGDLPKAGLLATADGSLYGTASSGGVSNNGSVFRLSSSGTLDVLHRFSGSDGSNPQAALIRGDDQHFYGTTRGGGDSGRGTVFRITAGGVLTMLHSFSGNDGDAPVSALAIDDSGHLYGTTLNGGAHSGGVVFRITPEGDFAVLHDFSEADGVQPLAGLVEGPDGNLYGTTTAGGTSGFGTVFRLSPSGDLDVVHAFSGEDGSGSKSALALDGEGQFYGAAANRAFAQPVVFRITPAGSLSVLFQHDAGTAYAPSSSLFRSIDGSIFGTTIAGGSSDLGAVFRLTPTASLEILFSLVDGFSLPFPGNSDGRTRLILGSDGNFYGTAPYNPVTQEPGLVVRITPSGARTVLHTFTGNVDFSINPDSPLAEGSDGGFYGTTTGGGNANRGTIFRVSTGGVFEPLHLFSGNDGDTVSGALIQSRDGYFYGATPQGGPSPGPFPTAMGTIFRMTPDGELTTLRTFSFLEAGQNPTSPSLEADTGDLYGIAGGGGFGGSTVYRMKPSGEFSAQSLTPVVTGLEEGSYSNLVQAADGQIYGAAETGGLSRRGAIFKLDGDDTLELVYSFSGPEGAYPVGLIVDGSDALMVATRAGGPGGGGTVTRIRLDVRETPTPSPSPTATPTVTPSPTPSSSPTPTPIPTPTASPTPDPTPSSSPSPSPGATPTPTSSPAPTTIPSRGGGGAWSAGNLLLIVLWYARRRFVVNAPSW